MAVLMGSQGHCGKTAHPFVSPLRYPGGKRKLTNFIKLVLRQNCLLDGCYVEPYAGGASIGIRLLFDEYVRCLHINDLDTSVFAFWDAVLNATEELCRLIRDTPVTIEQWSMQKNVLADKDSDSLARGFAAFFLNRTNRSGVISGGVIGGRSQTGKWKLNARFSKSDLIDRVVRIARYRERIHLYNADAVQFLRSVLKSLPSRALVYCDPPYYVAGKQDLYTNSYEPADHRLVAHYICKTKRPWLVSYDDVDEIRELYHDFRYLSYSLQYSAQNRYRGSEIMFFSQELEIPEVSDPARVTIRDVQRFSASIL